MEMTTLFSSSVQVEWVYLGRPAREIIRTGGTAVARPRVTAKTTTSVPRWHFAYLVEPVAAPSYAASVIGGLISSPLGCFYGRRCGRCALQETKHD